MKYALNRTLHINKNKGNGISLLKNLGGEKEHLRSLVRKNCVLILFFLLFELEGRGSVGQVESSGGCHGLDPLISSLRNSVGQKR